MSQSQKKPKYPTVKLYPKYPEGAPSGSNMVVELDGKKLPFVSFVKIEVSARKVNKVTIEMYAHTDVTVPAHKEMYTTKMVQKKAEVNPFTDLVKGLDRNPNELANVKPAPKEFFYTKKDIGNGRFELHGPISNMRRTLPVEQLNTGFIAALVCGSTVEMYTSDQVLILDQYIGTR